MTDNDEPTELARAVTDAVLAAVAAAGWTLDGRVIERGGERRWFTFGVEERPILEPPVGARVRFHAEGCVREGVVEGAVPGGFRVAFRYKSGTRSSVFLSTLPDFADRFEVLEGPDNRQLATPVH